jgi:ketosteroid isomerase-like protein
VQLLIGFFDAYTQDVIFSTSKMVIVPRLGEHVLCEGRRYRVTYVEYTPTSDGAIVSVRVDLVPA